MASAITYAFDSNARVKRVKYTGSSTIYEGMPLCYSYQSTRNWTGYGAATASASKTYQNTTAEGEQNEGKFIYVENPTCINVEDGTPADGSKTITGTTTDFDALQVGMFVTVSGDNVTDGTYEITAISRSTESGVTNSVITLDMDDADGTGDTVVGINNLQDFAGVVAGAEKSGQTGPCELDIYVPNGAVVPVRTVLTATVAGRTILSINSATQTFGNPTTDIDDFGRDTIGILDARPVAVAMETISSAGLCLAKLCPDVFLYQAGMDNQELQVSAGTVNTAVNKSVLDFKSTDGHSTAWLWRTRLSGTGVGSQLGVYRFDVLMDATTYGEYVDAVHINLEVACTAEQTTPGVVRGLGVMVRTQLDPDMSDTAVNVLCLDYHLRKNAAMDALTNPPQYGSYLRFNCSGSAPDYLFQAASPAAACFTANTTHAEDAKIGAIKVNIVGYGACYLWVYDGAA